MSVWQPNHVHALAGVRWQWRRWLETKMKNIIPTFSLYITINLNSEHFDLILDNGADVSKYYTMAKLIFTHSNLHRDRRSNSKRHRRIMHMKQSFPYKMWKDFVMRVKKKMMCTMQTIAWLHQTQANITHTHIQIRIRMNMIIIIIEWSMGQGRSGAVGVW